MVRKCHTKAWPAEASPCGSCRVPRPTVSHGLATGSHARLQGGVAALARMVWRRFGTAACVAICATLPLDAMAQGAAGDDYGPEGRTTTTVSPVEGRGFRIGASLKTLYDSNVLRLGNGLPLIAGYSRSDYRITPQISAAAGLPVGRQQLYIGADYGRDIYARNSQLDRDRYSIGGGAIWKLGRSCSGSVTAEYKRRQALLSEGSIRTDNTQAIQDYAAVGDCAPPIGLGFGGGVTRNVTDNQNVLRRAFDARDTSFDAHLNYGAPVLGQFSFGGTYSRISYPSRSLLVANSSGGFDTVGDHLNIFSARVGYTRPVGPRLSFNASGSYIKVKPDPTDTINLVTIPILGTIPISSPRAGYSGPGFTLGVDYHPGTRLSASLQASRNVTSSPTVGAQFVIRDSVAAAINYKVGPAITTTLGGSYDRRQYKGSFASTEEPLPRASDSISRVFGNISYAPRPLYAIDFEVAHQSRQSNPAIYNFSSTSAALTLRVKFGRQ